MAKKRQRMVDLCRNYNKKIKRKCDKLKKEYSSGKLAYDAYFFKLSKFLEGKSLDSWQEYYGNIINRLEAGKNVNHIHAPKEISQHINKLYTLGLINLVSLLIISVYLVINPSSTGLTILDRFTKPLIDMPFDQYMQNDTLIFAINPTSAGIYREVYIIKDSEIIDSIQFNCITPICSETEVIRQPLSDYDPGSYNVAIYDYRSNNYIFEVFNIIPDIHQGQGKITRKLLCQGCTDSTVPRVSLVNIQLSTENSGGYLTLTDYFPTDWYIVNSTSGYIIRYNSSHNRISWEYYTNDSTLSASYSLTSPDKLKNYWFVAEIEGVKANKGAVKII